MKNIILVATAISFCSASVALAQHSLQTDDGAGHIIVIAPQLTAGAPSTSTLTLPDGNGTVIMSGNGPNSPWLLGGNTLTNLGAAPTQWLGSSTDDDVIFKAQGVEKMRLKSGGGISIIGSLFGINGLAYIWPATTVGGALINDGAGTLSWAVVSPQYGGTGINAQAAANGKLLIGNGAGFSLSTLTAGTNITIDNTVAGQITINATAGGGGAPTGAATGDLSGNYPNPTVATVGTKTAVQISTTVTDVTAATNSNTVSTIVKRDASGNFSAGTITASLNGNATTATTATNFSGSLSGDVTGTQSATQINSANTGIGDRLISGVNAGTTTISILRLPPMVASGASHSAGLVPDPGVTAGTTKFLREDGSWQVPAGGGGTVTAVSVSTANGFAGSSSGGATPALTISTSVTGLLKGNGTAISAATGADLPTHSHSAADITSGILSVANGGTNSSTVLSGTARPVVTSATSMVENNATISNNTIPKWSGSNFANSSLSDDGTDLSTTGNLKLIGSNKLLSFKSDGTGVSTFVAGTQGTTTYNYTLPTTTPTANQVLTATAVGVSSPFAITLGWTTPSGGGTGVNYGATTTQNTTDISSTTYLYDLSYSATSVNASALGARINSTSTNGSNNATGLTLSVTAAGSGTATGLAVSVASTSGSKYAATFSGGNVGIGITNPSRTLEVVGSGNSLYSSSSSTADESFAIRGEATGASTTNQIIGVWGDASTSASNTASIGVLATGNGNTTVGASALPNVALQINDGELTVGRTSETASTLTSPAGTTTTTNAATAGTSYSADGPSGVISVTITTGFVVAKAQNEPAGLVTINNKYVKSTSIVLVQIMDATVTAGIASDAVFTTQVFNRLTGSFQLRVNASNGNNATNYTLTGYKIGYTVINPSK